MKNIIIMTIILLCFSSHSQEKDFTNWKDHEIEKYKILKKLANYVNHKKTNEISKDTLFKKYIYFDYVLNDSIKTRKEERLQSFDTLFSFFRKPIDSLGINNLDAKPIRFYKDNEIYSPFENQLKEIETEVFVYYKKEEPNKPLKCLFFDKKTNKLVAWILLNQGGYRYFLTFNLL